MTTGRPTLGELRAHVAAVPHVSLTPASHDLRWLHARAHTAGLCAPHDADDVTAPASASHWAARAALAAAVSAALAAGMTPGEVVGVITVQVGDLP